MASTGSDTSNTSNTSPIEGIRQYWSGLNRSSQVGMVVAVIAFILFVVLLVNFFAQPRMEVLFSNMDTLQAQEVAQYLDEEGVNYQLEDDGTTVKVPAGERDRLRLELSPDMHDQGMGFEIFEDPGLLESEFERRKRFQSALEEELRRTITSLDSVETARVHLALPDPQGFPAEAGEPSASVQLRRSPMVTLEEEQVDGIVYLVTGSVEDLEPKRVSVIDEEGNPLHDPLDHREEVTGLVQSEEQLQHRREFERELEVRLQDMLDTIYGPGNSDVMVHADLNFDREEREEIEYGENVPRSEQQIEERHEGDAPEMPEEVGDPNIPGYEAPMYQGDQEYEYMEEITNYEVDQVREVITTAPGRVERLSASVAVDEAGGGQMTIEEIDEMVSSAVGLDPERGDEVNVQLTAFEEEPLPLEPEPEPFFLTEEFIQYGIIALVALFLFILLLVFVLRKTREPAPAAEGEGQVPLTEGGLSMEGLMEEQPQERSQEQEMREKIQKLAEEQPDNVAYLLKTWLQEE